jgi:excisionase family DNA binding protein
VRWRFAVINPQSSEAIDLDGRQLPVLLTVSEVAELLRTSPRGVYAMVERRQIAGVVRIRRRLLFRSDALLHWVHQKSAPSLEE